MGTGPTWKFSNFTLLLSNTSIYITANNMSTKSNSENSELMRLIQTKTSRAQITDELWSGIM